MSQSAFPQTRWSLVLDVRGASESSRSEALAELCETYWYPVYGFVRRFGKGSEEAKDLTQGFFADFLRRDAFAKADPERGRMRTFLLTALKNYLASSHHQESARKRGGGFTILSIESEAAEGRYVGEVADSQLSPDLLFDRDWAQALFERALTQIRQQHESTGKLSKFEALKPYLAKKGADQSYAQIAKDLGESEGSIGVSVHRMRKRFRSFMEQEIRNTLASEDEFEAELAHFFTVFQR